MNAPERSVLVMYFLVKVECEMKVMSLQLTLYLQTLPFPSLAPSSPLSIMLFPYFELSFYSHIYYYGLRDLASKHVSSLLPAGSLRPTKPHITPTPVTRFQTWMTDTSRACIP